jgi:hypothetical protein
MVQNIVEINEKLSKLCPLKVKRVDLQKLNITIQSVFLSLNFLYIAPLPSTFNFFCNSPFGTSNIIIFSQFDKEMKKICSLKVKWVIQTRINDLKIQFPFLSFSSSYIVPFFFMFKIL